MSRDITSYQNVTNVVPENVNTVKVALAKAGEQIINTSQEAKITENLSNAQLELNGLQNQFKIDYQDKPFDEKGLADFNTAKQGIFDKYGKDVSSLYSGVWDTKTRQVSKTADASTQAWGFEQSKVNTTQSINTSMLNNYKLANSNGQVYGQSDNNSVDAALDFMTSHQELAGFGNKNLGAETTTKLLKDYNTDYMKSFISGVAETNPVKAAKMLDDPKIKEQFTTEQRDEFIGAIEKTRKKQELDKSLQQTVNDGQLSDIVNNQQSTYFDKRLQIDKLDMAGAISPKAASQARRVLSSQKDVDAVTDTPVMSGIITKIYDLNSIGDTSSSDYLNGVQNLHQEILENQAEGKLNVQDAQKLNNELRTLTSKKVADATKSVGNDFYDANQKFTALPPEFRGEATRQLFYATTGKNFNDSQMNDQANKVIDNFNKQRRTKAAQTVKAITAPDMEFLKSKGYSQADVAETAKIYGISEADVIKKLKAK